jgi:carbon storage regulator
MLVLTRKVGEKILIGDGITLQIVGISANRIRIGIDAPDHVKILRGELSSWQDSTDTPQNSCPNERLALAAIEV